MLHLGKQLDARGKRDLKNHIFFPMKNSKFNRREKTGEQRENSLRKLSLQDMFGICNIIGGNTI